MAFTGDAVAHAVFPGSNVRRARLRVGTPEVVVEPPPAHRVEKRHSCRLRPAGRAPIMSEDSKPVPEPGEAQRQDGEVQYFEVDETNVSGATEPPERRADDPAPEDETG
jgi:hypothetical protein